MTTAEQLDPPWPGDETEAEYRERFNEALRAVTNDEILEIIGGCNELASVLYVNVLLHQASEYEPNASDKVYLGDRIIEILQPQFGELAERKLSEGE